MSITAPWHHEARFDAELLPYRVAADRVMLGMCAFLQLVCLAIAPVHGAWAAALVVGGGTLALAAWLVRTLPGALLTRLFMACAFMTYTALVIHETGGSIEGHFTAFGLIGVLLYYRDWRVVAAATLFIYLHHMVLGYAQTLGWAVYVFDTREYSYKFAIHVAYFLPFVGLMGYLAIGLRSEGYENRQVIRLARDVAEGDFTRRLPPAADGAPATEGLLQAVERMRGCVIDLLRSMPAAVMIVRTDSDTVADVNASWRRLFGLDNPEAVGAEVARLPIWADAAPWSGCVAQLVGRDRPLLETPMRRADGTAFDAVVTAVEHRTGQLRLLVLSFEDVTLRREAERRMHQLAYHDMLTGLHNRAALTRHLDDLIGRRANERRMRPAGAQAWALMLLDLDDFKPVNDTHGHDAGDRVLQAVARRIDETRREGDFAARLGGDEFVVVLPDCPAPDVAYRVAVRLQSAIREPVALGAQLVCRVGATIGVAWYAAGAHPAGAGAALEAADAALYEGKHAGKGTIQVHGAD
jgi:diguanylate cyclase (GGDEF)-like protein/PAS domain S-box-containing protein